MEAVITLFALILLIILSTILNKWFPKIPLPLYQIILGLIFSASPLPLTLDFEPEMFMVIVIAPLLFWDGYNASRRALWRYKRPIILMAVGLVLVTVFGLGFFIHTIIPVMPLALTFALAAILSPTDAVAVKSIVRGMSLPRGLLPILEGESLLNDAAGLVAFKVAVAVALTGLFSPFEAAGEFLLMAIGGVLLGIVLGYIFVSLRLFLRKNGFEEVNSLAAIQLITPFLIYLLGEFLGVSGILTVVTAGIIHGIERDRLQQTTTKLQIVTNNIRLVLGYLLNGLVFILLGFLLPSVFAGLYESGEIPVWQVVTLVFAITAILFLIRFIWVFVLYQRFISPYCRFNNCNEAFYSKHFPRARYSFIAALGGIHGTITLATALSLPFFLADGSALPFRNTIIFIAAGVILLSFIMAILLLPLFATKEHKVPVEKMTNDEANHYITQRAIDILLAEATEENRLATNIVVKNLDEQLVYIEQGVGKGISNKKMISIQRIGIEAEERKLHQLVGEGRVSPQIEALLKLHFEQRVSHSLSSRIRRIWQRIKLLFLGMGYKRFIDGEEINSENPMHLKRQKLIDEFRTIDVILSQEAIDAIKKIENEDNRKEALATINHYTRRMEIVGVEDTEDEGFINQLKGLQLRGIQLEREGVQILLDKGEIPHSTAYALKQLISYDEMILLDEREF